MDFTLTSFVSADGTSSSATLSIDSAKKQHEGVYLCEANNNIEDAARKSIYLKVNGKLHSDFIEGFINAGREFLAIFT